MRSIFQPQYRVPGLVQTEHTVSVSPEISTQAAGWCWPMNLARLSADIEKPEDSEVGALVQQERFVPLPGAAVRDEGLERVDW